jgi:hypothetical protein
MIGAVVSAENTGAAKTTKGAEVVTFFFLRFFVVFEVGVLSAFPADGSCNWPLPANAVTWTRSIRTTSAAKADSRVIFIIAFLLKNLAH